MIALDTSSLGRFLTGIEDRDTLIVESALRAKAVLLPPVVLVEVLSNPALPRQARETIAEIPLVTLHEGYWMRCGDLRASLLKRKKKAALADCLIAQACIDSDLPLVTFDRDYRHFAEAGLRLL